MERFPVLIMCSILALAPAAFSGETPHDLPPKTGKTGSREKKPAAGEKAATKGKAAIKPESLKALPAWIPPLAGFQPAPGGKKWIEDDVEKGEISGTLAGEAREVAEGWAKAAREHFRGVTTNDATINGALTMTVIATYLKDAQLEHRVELEIKPAKDGKTCAVKLAYSISGEP